MQPSDLSNNHIIHEKATDFRAIFWILQYVQNLKVTPTRKDILAEKRHEKGTLSTAPISVSDVVWDGPPAPVLSTEETAWITSISDPTISGDNAQRFHATQEQETE
jgi:hypothetical protein